MSKTMTLTPKGLFTYYNALADISPGALLKANNIVIQQEGIAQPRRGIKYWSSIFGVDADRAKQLFEYKSRIFTHYSNKITFDTTGTGVFFDFNGTYSSPLANTRIKSLESKGNFYFTSNSGVKKISAKVISDITVNSISGAGVVAALGGQGKARIPAIGFLESQYKCIYKVTWALLDNNNLLVEGVPSDDITVYNNSAYNNTYVDLSIIVPTQINSTNYIYRIYRSNSVPVADTPEREFNLVFEGNPTGTEISTRRLNYTDKLINDFRSGGLPLYTNAVSGGGSLSANEIPPYAVDLALYSNHLFYANTKLAHFKEYSIQSIANLFNQTLTISDGFTSNEYFFDGAVEENTVKAEASAFTIPNAYFLLTAASNEREYYVLLKKNATAFAQNAETDQRFEILADITGLNQAHEVANAIADAINLVEDFNAVVVDSLGVIDPLGAYVRITNTNNGTAVTYDDVGAVISPYGLADSTVNPTNYIFSHQATGVGEKRNIKASTLVR